MDDLTEIPYESDEFTEGPELSYEMWVARQIGPRKVGGRYRSRYSGKTYEVLAIEPGPRPTWPTWQITVRGEDGQIRSHCTAWEERDQVIAEPESELTPLFAAWELAHPTITDHPEWRHVLDEIAHPLAIQAFHRLPVAT